MKGKKQMNSILARQSIRRFTKEAIAITDLEQLTQAAMAAPSSKNKQPWQLLILSERQLLDELAEVHPNWRLLAVADKAIVVCGDLQLDGRLPQVLLATAAATQNILIRSTEIEIGSVWLGAYPDESRQTAIQKRLNLPETVIPISVIALGHYEAERFPIKKRTIDQNKVHWNCWQETSVE